MSLIKKIAREIWDMTPIGAFFNAAKDMKRDIHNIRTGQSTGYLSKEEQERRERIRAMHRNRGSVPDTNPPPSNITNKGPWEK